MMLPDLGINLIGDPHLGKAFQMGVPLARRGERERLQFESFVSELAQPCKINIVVGDLFDHPYVSYAVVKQAADAVLNAAQGSVDTTFYVMAGNHDMPRNITAVGAFDIFVKMVSGRLPNLWTVTKPIIAEGIAMFPWEWQYSALEQLPQEGRKDVRAVVGHWDLSSFGGSDRHLAPVDRLRELFGDAPVYSGHYHVAGDYPVGEGVVHCTGSLQPYAADQDPEGHLYVTLSRSDALSRTDLRDKVVRVLLRPGEEMPALDALASTFKRLPPEIDEGASWSEPKAVTFDWHKTLASKLKPLDPKVQNFIMDKVPQGEQEH